MKNIKIDTNPPEGFDASGYNSMAISTCDFMGLPHVVVSTDDENGMQTIFEVFRKSGGEWDQITEDAHPEEIEAIEETFEALFQEMHEQDQEEAEGVANHEADLNDWLNRGGN